MASEFLRSSPARDENESRLLKPPTLSTTQTPASKKTTGASSSFFARSINSSVKKQQQQQQQQQQLDQHMEQNDMHFLPSFPPSASKFQNLPSLSGWTPLISKTYSAEQILSINSTPNKLFTHPSHSLNPTLQNVQRQGSTGTGYGISEQDNNSDIIGQNNNNNNNSNNNNSSGYYLPGNELEFQGFGFTPLINHNFNFLANTSGSQLFGITPFQERMLQQNCEIYIDSPIRNGNGNGYGGSGGLGTGTIGTAGTTTGATTNVIENFSITPSKFSLNAVASNKKILQDPLKSATKRSIALLDTPPRQPHKLSIITKAYNDDSEGKEVDSPSQQPCKPVRSQPSQLDGDETDGTDDDSDNDNDNDKANENENVNENNDFNKSDLKKDNEMKENLSRNLNTNRNANAFMQTPNQKQRLKPLNNISNKLKAELSTPADKKITPSSPSTIIIASTKKSSPNKPSLDTNNNHGHDLENEDDKENLQPPSPTPAKVSSNPPIMGIFTERKSTNMNLSSKPKPKPKPKPKKPSRPATESSSTSTATSSSVKTSTASTTSSASSSTSTSTTTTATKTKSTTASSTSSLKSVSTSSNGTSANKQGGSGKSQAENRAKMQAGMTKFQIVLSDTHNKSLAKNKKRLERNRKDFKKNVNTNKVTNSTAHEATTMAKNSNNNSNNVFPHPFQVHPTPPSSSSTTTTAATTTIQLPPVAPPQASSTFDNNLTMNTSREHSSILSHGGSINTSSHFNLTTDHSSFELGGLSSTPNSKVLLDRIFEKQSPQQTMQMQKQGSNVPFGSSTTHGLHLHLQLQLQPIIVDHTSFFQMQFPHQAPMGSTNMPPPMSLLNKIISPLAPHSSHAAHAAHTAHTAHVPQHPMMAIMSTPQHSQTYNINNTSDAFTAQLPSPWNFAFGTPQTLSRINNNINSSHNTTSTNNNQSTSKNSFQFTSTASESLPSTSNESAADIAESLESQNQSRKTT